MRINWVKGARGLKKNGRKEPHMKWNEKLREEKK